MPIFALATAVRQRSLWLLPKPAYVAIFFVVALAAYGWKTSSFRPFSADVPRQATAQVCLHDPNFAFQPAWQKILDQAKTEIRENLHMETQRSGQETVVAITLSGLPAETVVPTVNDVASAYSQACRAQRKLQLEQAHRAAAEKVQQSERQAFEAQTRFDVLRERHLRALANVTPSQTAALENPRWTEINRRLADLEERKRILLLHFMPLHPSVQEIEMQMTDVRREMASIPPKIAQEPPVDRRPQDGSRARAIPGVSPPEETASTEVQRAQKVAEQLKQELQQAQALEQAALAACGQELQIDLLAAESLPPPPHAGAALLGKVLVIATTSIVGLQMISFGASLEPTVSGIAELQTLLPAPVIGVIPATHPGRRRSVSPFRRRLARWGWITTGLAVLFAVAGLLC